MERTAGTLCDEDITQLIAAVKAGHALPRDFYADPAVFERDLDRIVLPHWFCAGHVSSVRQPGDFFLVDIAEESVIVVRDRDRNIRALLNVCRHRGSRVCTEVAGHLKGGVFVCPYHAWSYGLDGSLRGARHMSPGFDRAAHGLKSLHVRVIEGLIFLCFAENPLGLEDAQELLASTAGVYGWADAKVAHRETYSIKANWKLAVENYFECYHCQPSHEEYAKFHLYARPVELNRDADERMRARARDLGIALINVDHWGVHALPGQEGADSYSSALAEGAVTGTEDGRPAAPLMGKFRDYIGGTTFFDVGPTSTFLAYPDYGVIYRFIPKNVDTSEMEIIWLVNGTARAGIDYDLERLTWLWKLTSIADKRIIEVNQQGVNSRYYEPGPYTPMEAPTQNFIAWYLRAIGAEAPAGMRGPRVVSSR